MNRPNLSDYGITEAALPWSEKIEREVRNVTASVALLIAPIGLIIRPSIWFLVIGWLCAWLILWGGFTLRLWLVNTAYRSVKRYKKALAEFDQWWIRTQEVFWLSLSGLQFEHELAALYRRLGIKATLTPASGDGGVDIWLHMPDGERIVQCKAHRTPVGPSVARELHGALVHLGAKGAVLASTSGFTRGVREFSKGKPIQLLGLAEIIAMQKAIEHER